MCYNIVYVQLSFSMFYELMDKMVILNFYLHLKFRSCNFSFYFYFNALGFFKIRRGGCSTVNIASERECSLGSCTARSGWAVSRLPAYIKAVLEPTVAVGL